MYHWDFHSIIHKLRNTIDHQYISFLGFICILNIDDLSVSNKIVIHIQSKQCIGKYLRRIIMLKMDFLYRRHMLKLYYMHSVCIESWPLKIISMRLE